MARFFAKTVLLPEGWANDVSITTDDNGLITTVETNSTAQAATVLNGVVIPGMPNLHSHAFQYAFAGQSEFATAEQDSFWTWRKLMYQFLETRGAEELENIATQLYSKMLQKGYTHVGEFHYIHHQPDGTRYDDPAHLAHAMIRAAQKTGIGITMLPVLYAYSGFGNQEPEDGQKRFLHTTDSYLDLIHDLYTTYKDDPLVRIGIAFHSLRAVSPDMISEVCQAVQDLDKNMPIHIHIAEEEKEVEDCLAWSGKRPVEWLCDNNDIGPNWCLVHATHMTEDETTALAKSGAVAGICPTTEANLGDGFFNLPQYIREGGTWGIGSDSHISVDAVEELRWLEYGQRLLLKQRAIARTENMPHVGDYLYHNALKGGAQAMGVNIGELSVGSRADFLVLSNEDIAEDIRLDTLVFADTLKIIQTYTAGILR